MRTLASTLLFAGLAGCAAARPPPRELPGPTPQGPAELELARALELARDVELELLSAPASALRPPATMSPAKAGLRIDRAEAALARVSTGRIGLDARRAREHAALVLRRARDLWESGRAYQAHRVDAVFVRTRRALAAGAAPGATLAALAERVEDAAPRVFVVNERERAWALARLEGHALTLPLGGEGRGESALQQYRAQLASTSTRAPEVLGPALARALGATVSAEALRALTASAASALRAARARLYGLALEVTPSGPSRVDARVRAALERARIVDRGGPAGLTARLEAWLAAAGAPPARLELNRAGELVAVGTASAAATPPLDEGGGSEARLARLAVVAAELVSRAQVPPSRPFGSDPVTLRARATALLGRLARTDAASPEAKLLLASVLVERRARALAELLSREDRDAAIEVLMGEASHGPEDARAVLDTAAIAPGRFVAPFAAESWWDGTRRSRCAGWPAAIARACATAED